MLAQQCQIEYTTIRLEDLDYAHTVLAYDVVSVKKEKMYCGRMSANHQSYSFLNNSCQFEPLGTLVVIKVIERTFS